VDLLCGPLGVEVMRLEKRCVVGGRRRGAFELPRVGREWGLDVLLYLCYCLW
jgi:hypothetical protein